MRNPLYTLVLGRLLPPRGDLVSQSQIRKRSLHVSCPRLVLKVAMVSDSENKAASIALWNSSLCLEYSCA